MYRLFYPLSILTYSILCQAAAQDFVSHLLSEESIAEQVQIMKDSVCPQVTHKAHLIFS